MTARWLGIIVLALAVIAGLHAYIGHRITSDLALSSDAARAVWGMLALLLACVVLQPISLRRGWGAVTRIVAPPAALWLGVGFLLLAAFAATDLLVLALVRPAFAATSVKPGAAAIESIRTVVVLAGTAGATAIGIASAVRLPRLRRIRIELDRAPASLAGLRIVQLTDLHIGPMLGRRFLARVVARANALEPDVVAVTGDLVDGRVDVIGAEVEPLRELRPRYGAFFVTGNHDHYSDADAWVERVSGLGLRPLRNAHVRLSTPRGDLSLAGVDDHRGGVAGSSEDLDRALDGCDASLPIVLLAHDPSTFKRACDRVDLQLSGHTHGGQIWPFRYLVRLAVPWVAGLYRRGRGQLYVSRGTGFWGPPMRLGAPAELTEITLYARRPD
jgi:hypothetical protein